MVGNQIIKSNYISCEIFLILYNKIKRLKLKEYYKKNKFLIFYISLKVYLDNSCQKLNVSIDGIEAFISI